MTLVLGPEPWRSWLSLDGEWKSPLLGVDGGGGVLIAGEEGECKTKDRTCASCSGSGVLTTGLPGNPQ